MSGAFAKTFGAQGDSQGVEAHPFALGTIARRTILSSSAASRRFCFRGSIPSLCAPLSTFVRLAAGGTRIRTLGPAQGGNHPASTTGGKPAPDPFLIAAGRLGVDP